MYVGIAGEASDRVPFLPALCVPEGCVPQTRWLSGYPIAKDETGSIRIHPGVSRDHTASYFHHIRR